MKRVAVLGASGFIGGHLVTFLKKKGYWVRGVDKKKPEFSKSNADEFLVRDLQDYNNCLQAVNGVKEVYQLAAEMGGMGFISSSHLASFNESNLINTYVPMACVTSGVKRLFFSSSACVYPISKQNELYSEYMMEKNSYPADPNEAYGWEKIMAERRYQEYQRLGLLETRIARFENTYGPEGKYEGGREKAPAAICRKVVLAKNEVEVWGDGKAQRSYMYIDDCVKGICQIMRGNYSDPVNLGNGDVVSVDELASLTIKISGKDLRIKHIKGPQGVRSRYVSHSLAKKLYGWRCKVPLEEGLTKLYKWIESRYER